MLSSFTSGSAERMYRDLAAGGKNKAVEMIGGVRGCERMRRRRIESYLIRLLMAGVFCLSVNDEENRSFWAGWPRRDAAMS